jgi:hypothetical protein
MFLTPTSLYPDTTACGFPVLQGRRCRRRRLEKLQNELWLAAIPLFTLFSPQALQTLLMTLLKAAVVSTSKELSII